MPTRILFWQKNRDGQIPLTRHISFDTLCLHSTQIVACNIVPQISHTRLALGGRDYGKALEISNHPHRTAGKIRNDSSLNPKPQARNEMEGDSTERHVFCQTNLTEPQGKLKT